jgi:PAS domain S-box-containing protein
LLFDAIPLLGWVANAVGDVTYCNRRWFEYTGTTFAQMEGTGWQAVHDPEHLPQVLERWRAAIVTGDSFHMSFPIRRHDGVFRWFTTRATPVRDASGCVVRWVATSTDVDDQRRVELSLKAAVRTREEVIAVVAHDLRNPLNTILLGAKQIELLADVPGSASRSKKVAQTMHRAVGQMTRLISDLLDLAKLEANQPLALEPEPHVDLSALARDVAESLTALVTSRRLTLETQLPPLPVHATCDPDRIRQVLDNLIGNAIKFTREGGHIDLSLRPSGDDVLFSIRDTGVGISAAQLSQVFRPYWQADPEQKRGAGLGLAIVKAIVDAHGGRVWVESVEGAGSTFHFTLPAADGGRGVERQSDE